MIAPTNGAPLAPQGATSDAVLVERSCRGDRTAFALLYRRHVTGIYNLILKLTGSAPDAEELTQETFYQAYRSLPHFERRSTFLTWLYRIATNVGLMYRKRCAITRQRFVTTGPHDRDPLAMCVAPTPGPSEQVEQRQQFRALFAAIDALPDEQRVALILGPIQGHSYEQIAEILQISIDAVKGRMHRARANLRRRLGRGLPALANAQVGAEEG